MKQIYPLIFFLFFCIQSIFSQIESENVNGMFYKISLATTLTINEEYQAFDDSDETLINPSALYINNTFGYQFDMRTSVGLNLGYNWHSQQGLHFAPAYLSLRHNFVVDDSNIFARAGYGTLLGVSKDFQKGNMYKLGLGVQMYGDDYNKSVLLGVDFTRKRFGYRALEGLSSISIFLEFMLF
jgi:hypothetical protein